MKDCEEHVHTGKPTEIHLFRFCLQVITTTVLIIREERPALSHENQVELYFTSVKMEK